MTALGARVEQGDDWTEVGSPGLAAGFRPRAIDADFNHIAAAAMTAAVVALFADGPSVLRNIGSWRVKETDSTAATAAELTDRQRVVQGKSGSLRVALGGRGIHKKKK